MAFKGVAFNYKMASCLWSVFARRITCKVVIRDDKPYTPSNLKGKRKLPPPHQPVKYPPNWKFPEHNLSEKDMENYEPPKLLMVRRVAPIGGTLQHEKLILSSLRLFFDKEDITIVKNTPSMNLTLFRIKRLIEVKPITFPNGLPERGDYSGTYLTKNGEFIVNKKLKIDEKALKVPEDYARKRIDDKYLREHLIIKFQQKYDLLHKLHK